MSRNRVIYQSEALFVSKNINSVQSGDHLQVRRVQSANYNFSIERQDVNQFGQLARIDALVLASPTVTLDFSYYPTDGFNENILGFYVQTGNGIEGNFSSGQMGSSSGQNYYIVTAAEGQDLNTEVSTQYLTATGNVTGTGYHSSLSGKSVIAIGNAFLSNYTFDASVGNLPTVSVTVEGLNIKSSTYQYRSGIVTGIIPPDNIFQFGTGTSGRIEAVSSPSIDPVLGSELGLSGTLQNPSEATGTAMISALRPGDIVFGWDAWTGTSQTGAPIVSLNQENSINIQSASLQLPLSRTPIERLGSRFAFARVVDFPIVASLNISAIVNEIEAKSLASMLDDNSKRNITLSIKKPGEPDVYAMKFTMKGAQLQSESFSSSIGANKTVDLVFQTQIGGPSDTNNGIYLSGSYADEGNSNGQWGY
jgi:hypothetical protein